MFSELWAELLILPVLSNALSQIVLFFPTWLFWPLEDGFVSDGCNFMLVCIWMCGYKSCSLFFHSLKSVLIYILFIDLVVVYQNILCAGCQTSLMPHKCNYLYDGTFLDCRKCLAIKNTLLKLGQAKSKIWKRNNRSTNISQNDSVRLANGGALDFCFELLCRRGTALPLCAGSMNISKP